MAGFLISYLLPNDCFLGSLKKKSSSRRNRSVFQVLFTADLWALAAFRSASQRDFLEGSPSYLNHVV